MNYLTASIVPNSEQVNADDLVKGPRTVTITGMEEGTKEQRVFIHLVEFPGRTYRPSKTMRKLIVAMWGEDPAVCAGRMLTLYRNPDTMFGKERVGGIEISHASHIAEPFTTYLQSSRGKRRKYTVQPLPDAAPARDWLSELALTDGDLDLIAALGTAAKTDGADETILAAIREEYRRVKETAI